MGIANESNCIATTHPEFAKLFWNVEDSLVYTYSSKKKADFKCPICLNKIPNKTIGNVYSKGLPCQYCSDGLSYPEKFMFSLLEQVRIEFNHQKTFVWSKNKQFDFYIPSLNCIIETHGEQHYEKTPRGRTLKEEQENDEFKYNLAFSNKISKYYAIDCRKSELEWIRNSILKSNMNLLFDLSNIDWLKCHEFACSSFVKKSCDLWNEGIRSTVEISRILNFHSATISRYLKRGKILGWVDYDPKSVLRQNGRSSGEIFKLKRSKKVIQLTKTGDFIKEWESLAEAGRQLGIGNSDISATCNRKQKTAGGYSWMLKTDYEKTLKQNKSIS